jgi:cyclopropane fatty-acyl-phospholipid synthase-like methyltransferase
MSDQETVNVYAAQADKYAAITEDDKVGDAILASFMAALPASGHLLDLGCGPGAAAGIMAAEGFKVTATDAVPEMVELASKHAGVNASCATFDEISGENEYDGIWANFSLLHATKADMPRHLAALSKALKPNGLFHIGMKKGNGERRDSLGRHYSYYLLGELSTLLQAAGLTVTQHQTGRAIGLDGTMANWICVRAYG